jgi:hypothetical protein
MMTSIAEPDYWALLGLDPGSDGDSLKRAFRREARRCHPDLNGNDRQAEERFKLVNEAYAVLSDHDRRVAWERQRNGRSPAKTHLLQDFLISRSISPLFWASVILQSPIVPNPHTTLINSKRSTDQPHLPNLPHLFARRTISKLRLC